MNKRQLDGGSWYDQKSGFGPCSPSGLPVCKNQQDTLPNCVCVCVWESGRVVFIALWGHYHVCTPISWGLKTYFRSPWVKRILPLRNEWEQYSPSSLCNLEDLQKDLTSYWVPFGFYKYTNTSASVGLVCRIVHGSYLIRTLTVRPDVSAFVLSSTPLRRNIVPSLPPYLSPLFLSSLSPSPFAPSSPLQDRIIRPISPFH